MRESGLVRENTNTLLGTKVSRFGSSYLQELPGTINRQVSGASGGTWEATATFVQVWEPLVSWEAELGSSQSHWEK